MNTLAHDQQSNGPYRLALALLFVAPSAIALFASFALAHRARFPASALWFIYEVSLFAGCVGVGITAVMTVVEAVRRQIAPAFPWLMGIAAVIGIFLLWYAKHIYQSP